MSENGLSRREFSHKSLQALLTFAFLETVVARDAFGKELQPIAAQWIKDLHEMGQDVKGGKIEQTVWQKKVEGLFDQVELPELMKFLDFKKLTTGIEFRDVGERSLRQKFPKVEGLPTELVFGHQIFALKKDRSVPPHAHDNMCTAFLVLEGTFHGRHYDRLESDRRTMIVRPSIDQQFKAGESSTVTETKDNIHWFKTTSDTGFIFNIHILGVHEGKKTGRVYIDPDGEKLSDNRIKVDVMKAAVCFRKYG